MRGQCAYDETTDLYIPCVYDGDPVPVKDQESRDFLKTVCPSLKLGKNVNNVKKFEIKLLFTNYSDLSLIHL